MEQLLSARFRALISVWEPPSDRPLPVWSRTAIPRESIHRYPVLMEHAVLLAKWNELLQGAN
jgi:hypothetical protein